jgi:hypothetical protein
MNHPGRRVEGWRGNPLGEPLSVSGVSTFVPVGGVLVQRMFMSDNRVVDLWVPNIHAALGR